MDNEAEDIDNLIDQLAREAIRLEENGQWKEVIDVCLKWLQYSNRDFRALKSLALAYSHERIAVEAEKYCNIALSILPSDSLERLPFERIKQRVLIEKNIPSYKAANTESVWTSLLEPELQFGQAWIGDDDIGEIEKQLSLKLKDFDFSAADEICANCWHEITRARRYAIPSKGRIEILTTEKIKNLLGIQEVRFVQEGVRAPEVYLRFEFTGSKIGVLRIINDGKTIGFHENSNIVKSILDALALTYYRDLVVPIYNEVDKPRKKRSYTPKLEHEYDVGRPEPKRLPRQYLPQKHEGVYEFREWHLAQHRARHGVVGHIRWISPGFIADREKQEQALRAGVELPMGYTWVIEHERGGQEGTYLVLDGTDLPRRTRFLPPTRAGIELDRLLSAFE